MNFKRLGVASIAATLLCALFLFTQSSIGLTQPAGTKAKAAQSEVQRITVTGATIAALPPGKSYIMKLGSRRLIIPPANSGSNTRPHKEGAGQLILPNSNAQPTNQQTPANSNSRQTKQGQGDVILSGSNATGSASADSYYGSGVYKVYEFRSDARHPIDFSRVVVQEGESTNYVKLEEWLRKHRPARGMRGWPFKRLLVGPGKGIAQIEGWKLKDVQPGTEYHCEKDTSNDGPDGFCSCNSLLDCAVMVVAGNCTSELTCGDGECFCENT